VRLSLSSPTEQYDYPVRPAIAPLVLMRCPVVSLLLFLSDIRCQGPFGWPGPRGHQLYMKTSPPFSRPHSPVPMTFPARVHPGRLSSGTNPRCAGRPTAESSG